MRFRPCIDLHNGQVKQIVGSSLSDDGTEPQTNFIANRPPKYFAELYREDELEGGHVIMLGPGNEKAATAAVSAYPRGLQVGGGITPQNAATWLEKGADKVIVTSYVFVDGHISWDRLAQLAAVVEREKLVLDLSCRIREGRYFVVMDRWQTFTDVEVTAEALQHLSEYCVEFLVHAVDIEGKQRGIDTDLVQLLAAESPLPVTYAGGISNLADLCLIEKYGEGRVDATVGSALDIFGGALPYKEVVDFDRERRRAS